MRFYIETYGCTLNRYDSEVMRKILKERGHLEVEREEEADVVIINTCSVKDSTEKKIIERLKGIKKRLIVAGCLGAAMPDYVRRFAPHAEFVNPREVGRIMGGSSDKFEVGVPPQGIISALAISDGCLNNCSFCHTKIARPGLKSMDEDRILRFMERADREGVRELRLTSQDLGAYGRDKNTNLLRLLRKMRDLRIRRMMVRLGMINPQHLIENMEIIDVIRETPFIFRFIHVPVQSGSDRVLEIMNRGHSVDDYREIVREVRKDSMFNVMTDMIVGHPGEDEDDFEESLQLVEETEPDTVNVSKFSPRPGTASARMEQIDRRIVNERSKRMSEVVNKVALRRNLRWVGKITRGVIVERVKTNVAKNLYYKSVAVDGGDLDDELNLRIVGAGVGHIKGVRI